MKTLVIANQKGGVGKSTLTVHLAHAAKAANKKILLVDMDKQGSLSLTFQRKNDQPSSLLASALFDSKISPLEPEAIDDNISILRADSALLAIDRAENKVIDRPRLALQRFSKDFDLCFIDTPPALCVRLMASLAASDFVVTPVSVGFYEIAGVADLMQTIHVVRTQGFNPRLKHIGFLIMKLNSRSKEELAGLEKLRKIYKNVILEQSLPERAAVRQAIAQRKPVWEGVRGEGHKRAANEWLKACNDIILKIS